MCVKKQIPRMWVGMVELKKALQLRHKIKDLVVVWSVLFVGVNEKNKNKETKKKHSSLMASIIENRTHLPTARGRGGAAILAWLFVLITSGTCSWSVLRTRFPLIAAIIGRAAVATSKCGIVA